MSPTLRMRVTVQAGDDHPIVIPVLGEDGQPRDVTGWSARSQVRRYPGAPVLHTWSTADGSAHCTAEGVVLMVDDSDSWDWTSGEFDVIATAPDGARTVPGAGRIQVRALVTTP